MGRNARSFFDRADRGEAILLVPTIALVEISEAAHAGRYVLEGGFSGWAGDLVASGMFVPVDLSWEIVLFAEGLYSIPERSDRLIAATAAYLGHPLVTRDPAIGEAAGVEVVW